MAKQFHLTLNWYEIQTIKKALQSEYDFVPIGSQDYWNIREANRKINTAIAEENRARRVQQTNG
jgi:hypothetical protein